MSSIMPSARLRSSPFYTSTLREGVTSFTAYNHMLMPTGYGHAEEEYWRVINGVSMWDVAVERQIQLKGRDAGKLAQTLATRDLSNMAVQQGKYVALCNHAGTLINDPIVLKLADDRYWLSIADSDVLLWAKAVAAERALQVDVSEPDVSPLAVQGPKAEDVVASMFGNWVRGLKHFWFREAEVDGIPVAVARSGWSKQGGFELYLMDGSKGEALWNRVREAGKPWDIGPGNPNVCERVEGGLLSYGGDTDDHTNPFEVRLGRFVDLDLADDVIGITALRRLHKAGIARHQLGLILEGEDVAELPWHWLEIMHNGTIVGAMTNCVWSYRLHRNIGFALVSVAAQAGDEVEVVKDGRRIGGKLTTLPFL